MKRHFYLLMIFFSIPALAYVDPGSGFMIWQLTVSAVIGVFFGIGQWVLRLFRKNQSKKDSQ